MMHFNNQYFTLFIKLGNVVYLLIRNKCSQTGLHNGLYHVTPVY